MISAQEPTEATAAPTRSWRASTGVSYIEGVGVEGGRGGGASIAGPAGEHDLTAGEQRRLQVRLRFVLRLLSQPTIVLPVVRATPATSAVEKTLL